MVLLMVIEALGYGALAILGGTVFVSGLDRNEKYAIVIGPTVIIYCLVLAFGSWAGVGPAGFLGVVLGLFLAYAWCVYGSWRNDVHAWAKNPANPKNR